MRALRHEVTTRWRRKATARAYNFKNQHDTSMVSGVERRRARQRRARKRHKSTSNDGEKYVSAAQTTSGTTSSPSSVASASVQSASDVHTGPPSRRPAEAKRKIIQHDVKNLIATLKSDAVDDSLTLSRRKELDAVAKQLEVNMHDYVHEGRRHTYAVFSSFNDLIAGAIGAVRDQLEGNATIESPPPAPEPVGPAPGLSDVASTMARLEQRLHAMAAEVADLIGHVEAVRSRP